MVKALLLLSGGLDSTLAGHLLLDLGVEVEAVNFTSPFCRCTPKSYGCSAARLAADRMGVPVHVLVKGDDYLEIVKRPKHGRGSGMNPCLDCRIYTFRHAKEMLSQIEADFVATGEVLGQRPMSQRRNAMELIERESGLQGMIVRPLSARLLPPSIPEQQGLIDRDRLLAVQGRSRKPQLALAEEHDLQDFPCPAGGCLLTDPGFAARMRELLEHEPDFDMADARLLTVGRHFRLPEGAKAVVGRDQSENERLNSSARPGDVLLAPAGVPGPTALLRRPPEGPQLRAMLHQAAGLVSRYTGSGSIAITISRARSGGTEPGVVLQDVAETDHAVAESWRVGGSV